MTTAWKVPPMWRGRTVAVLASGPSMSLQVATLARRAGAAVAVNDTYRLAPWADVLYGADADWWRRNPQARDFPGLKVCADDSLLWPEVLNLRHTGKSGFDPDPTCIRSGGNSGYQAVHVAAQAGAARILLCGFDMGGGHWHGAPAPAAERFTTWIKHFATLADGLGARGVEVINCTPGSALTCFQRMPLEEALA